MPESIKRLIDMNGWPEAGTIPEDVCRAVIGEPVETVSTQDEASERHYTMTETPPLTRPQQRVVESKARIIVLHGERHSGKTYAGFAALEKHAAALLGTPQPIQIDTCRQMIITEVSEHRDWLLREYAHYLIRAGWGVGHFDKAAFGAHFPGSSLGQLVVRGISTRSDGGHIVGRGESYHSILQLTDVGAFIDGPQSQWYRMASRVLGRGGLHVVELTKEPNFEFVEFGESL